MGRPEWDPEGYLDLMRAELPRYGELQDRVTEATAGLDVRDVLELGTGTGETSRRILALHPGARLTGIDGSPEMLAAARRVLGNDPLLLVARLEDPLPPGPYDLVVSALAVHHLDAEGKRTLFRRVASVLRAGGRFVLGDVVVPEDPDAALTPLGTDDLPDTVADQLEWLAEAGLAARAVWAVSDLAVLVADCPPGRDGPRPPTSP